MRWMVATLVLFSIGCIWPGLPDSHRRLNECEWQWAGHAWQAWTTAWLDGKVEGLGKCGETKFRIHYAFSHQDMLDASGGTHCGPVSGPSIDGDGDGGDKCKDAKRVWGWAAAITWNEFEEPAVLMTIWHTADTSVIVHEMVHAMEVCSGRGSDRNHGDGDGDGVAVGPVWGPEGVQRAAMDSASKEEGWTDGAAQCIPGWL